MGKCKHENLKYLGAPYKIAAPTPEEKKKGYTRKQRAQCYNCGVHIVVPIEELSQKQLLVMMEHVVMDRDLFCPYCLERLYEADYDRCNNCGRVNPLREKGII